MQASQIHTTKPHCVLGIIFKFKKIFELFNKELKIPTIMIDSQLEEGMQSVKGKSMK